jgi:hypothetical protein
VYVAATSAGDETARVTAAVAALRAHGIDVTCTWANTIAKVGDANPRDASDIDRRGWAIQCLNEIDASDAVWFLVPTPPTTTRGGWGEALYAYSEKKHLVFSGDTKQSIFCALGHECVTDAQAVNHLRILRDRKRIESGLAELRRQTNWPTEHEDDCPALPSGHGCRCPMGNL